jgi:hypothetical protein
MASAFQHRDHGAGDGGLAREGGLGEPGCDAQLTDLRRESLESGIGAETRLSSRALCALVRFDPRAPLCHEPLASNTGARGGAGTALDMSGLMRRASRFRWASAAVQRHSEQRQPAGIL